MTFWALTVRGPVCPQLGVLPTASCCARPPTPAPRGACAYSAPLSNAGLVRPGANFRNFCMEGFAVIPSLTGFCHYTHVCEIRLWCHVLYIAVLGPLQLLQVVPLCEYTQVSGVVAPECHHEMQRVCKMKAGQIHVIYVCSLILLILFFFQLSEGYIFLLEPRYITLIVILWEYVVV